MIILTRMKRLRFANQSSRLPWRHVLRIQNYRKALRNTLNANIFVKNNQNTMNRKMEISTEQADICEMSALLKPHGLNWNNYSKYNWFQKCKQALPGQPCSFHHSVFERWANAPTVIGARIIICVDYMSDNAAPHHHIILYSLSSASIVCHSLCIIG